LPPTRPPHRAPYYKSQGDKTRASTYTAAAASIKDTLNSHFDSSASYIFETDSRKKDAAVVSFKHN